MNLNFRLADHDRVIGGLPHTVNTGVAVNTGDRFGCDCDAALKPMGTQPTKNYAKPNR
jgi:hypothetical protein